jgi:hypothetical protein
MWPLSDITIYYDGLKIPSLPKDADFSNKKNYICDFYHKMLNGYKPPKTGRICIHIANEKRWDEPNYFGAICSISNIIDEDKYISLSQIDKYKYILDIVHQSCLTLAKFYKWDIHVFQNAFDTIYKLDFKFTLDYPQKKSKDKKTLAHVHIEKTETTSSLYLIFVTGETNKKVKLFEKQNWFWYDSVYKFAANSKWLDKVTFGVHSKNNSRFAYYSTLDDIMIGKIEFGETDF